VRVLEELFLPQKLTAELPQAELQFGLGNKLVETTKLSRVMAVSAECGC
jgi:hypothetical protein